MCIYWGKQKPKLALKWVGKNSKGIWLCNNPSALESGLSWSYVLVMNAVRGKKKKKKKQHSINLDSISALVKNCNDNLELQPDKLAGLSCFLKPGELDEPKSWFVLCSHMLHKTISFYRPAEVRSRSYIVPSPDTLDEALTNHEWVRDRVPGPVREQWWTLQSVTASGKAIQYRPSPVSRGRGESQRVPSELNLSWCSLDNPWVDGRLFPCGFWRRWRRGLTRQGRGEMLERKKR